MTELVLATPTNGVLEFDLIYNQECRKNIHLKNTSGGFLVYKVKTTLPDSYYVSPHLNCLRPGGEIDLKVTLLNAECNKFIELRNAKKVFALDKHRFKVECAAIQALEYESILTKHPEEQLRMLGDYIKNVSGNDKIALKYKVQYTYPPTSSDAGSVQSRAPATDRSNGAGIALDKGAYAAASSRMQYAINNRGNQQQNHQNADEYTGPGLDPNSIDAVLSEFQSLRTKYDKVVELTVNLQAEKDTMDERLRAKIEERKDINQKKDRERKGAKALANSHKRRGTFSYMFLIITAVLAYALGYYLEHRKIWSFTSTATEGDAAEEL